MHFLSIFYEFPQFLFLYGFLHKHPTEIPLGLLWKNFPRIPLKIVPWILEEVPPKNRLEVLNEFLQELI